MHEKNTFTRDDFYFELPDDRIAQYPSDRREDSRLMVLNRKNGDIKDDYFYNAAEYLHEGDILVFNNTRVLCARSFFRRNSGARVEVIFTRQVDEKKWLIATNRTKRLKPGETLENEKDNTVALKILSREDDFLMVEGSRPLTEELLSGIGEIPLPPYIKREAGEQDRVRYQTVYAAESGSAASPTAGLHFTQNILSELKKKALPFYS